MVDRPLPAAATHCSRPPSARPQSSRSLRTSEFEDDENLCTLESLLCQQGTREVLLPAELEAADRKALLNMLEATN